MASLDELRDLARRTYRYWPIYLVLRLRELEQHLDPDDRPALLSLCSAVVVQPVEERWEVKRLPK